MAERDAGSAYDPMQVEEPLDDKQASTSDDDSEADEPQCLQRGRKRVRNPSSWKKKHVKKRGLRQNAPKVTIDVIVEKRCCKKVCVQQFTTKHLASLRQHFGTMTYDEQNLYLTGLMIRKETKKSVGHKQKSNPVIGKNGKKVGRPPAEESHFSVEYQIRNQKGHNQRVCQKVFLLIHGFGKCRIEFLRKKMPVGSAVPEADRRGKHSNRPCKVSEELHQKIRDHIMSFPAQQSHY